MLAFDVVRVKPLPNKEIPSNAPAYLATLLRAEGVMCYYFGFSAPSEKTQLLTDYTLQRMRADNVDLALLCYGGLHCAECNTKHCFKVLSLNPKFDAAQVASVLMTACPHNPTCGKLDYCNFSLFEVPCKRLLYFVDL